MSQGGQGQNDNSMDMVYVFVAIMVVFLIVKMIFGEQLMQAWLASRLYLIGFIDLIVPGHQEALAEAAYKIRAYHPREWQGTGASELAAQLRPFIWPVLALPMLAYTYRIWKRNPGNRFKRKLSRVSLVKSEQQKWPWLTPVMGLDLVNVPIDNGPWAMARRPLDFARHYRLLDGHQLNKVAAAKLFDAQLGPLWEGVNRLRSHERALFACFIAHACHDRKAGGDGLARLALTMPSGKPDFAFVQALLDKHMDNKLVADVLAQHAYVSTVLCAALKAARRTGVLPPNYFVWLRPMNRRLWYALNCVGRHTPFADVAGIHAHRLAEDVLGHKLEMPCTERAVDALSRSLSEIKFE